MWRSLLSAHFMVATLLCAPVYSTAANQPPTPKLSLADCLRAALAAGPQRARAAADLALAQAKLDEAKAGRWGQVEYTQIVGLVNGARGDPVFSPDEQTDFLDDLGPFTRLELEIRLPLYTFGKLSAALKAAENGLRVERARGEMARADTVLEIKRLYYGLLLSRQLSLVLRDMMENMDGAIEKTQARLDADVANVTERDVLRLRIGRSKFASGVERVAASQRLTKRALARAIGMPVDADFEIADRRLKPVAAELENLELYVEGSVRSRPEWSQIESGLAAQDALIKLEEAASYPTLFLATGVRYAVAGNRDDQKNVFANDDFNYIQPVGVLGLHWDLNFFSNNAKAAQARATKEKLLAERRHAESGLRLDAERAFIAFERAAAMIDFARAGRKSARGLLVLTVTNYDLGIGDAEELFEAYGAYTETSTDYFRAVHDYNVAVAELSRAVGRELLDLSYE